MTWVDKHILLNFRSKLILGRSFAITQFLLVPFWDNRHLKRILQCDYHVVTSFQGMPFTSYRLGTSKSSRIDGHNSRTVFMYPFLSSEWSVHIVQESRIPLKLAKLLFKYGFFCKLIRKGEFLFLRLVLGSKLFWCGQRIYPMIRTWLWHFRDKLPELVWWSRSSDYYPFILE